MPVGVEKIVKAAIVLQETGDCNIDLYLKGAIEGVVIKWATQINDVMVETPSNAFNNGQNPLPIIGTNSVRFCGFLKGGINWELICRINVLE